MDNDTDGTLSTCLEGKTVRFATVNRPTMIRSHLALAIETPIWSGSPQGVVCFTTTTPPEFAGDRKAAKRWSFYGSRGHSLQGNNRSGRSKKDRSPEKSDTNKLPPPPRLTPEPEDITDRLCLRRRWTSSESFRPINVFEPNHQNDATPESKSVSAWRQTIAKVDTPPAEQDMPGLSLMYSWKGDACAPNIPDSREMLPEDPISALALESPKVSRSLSIGSSASSGALLSSTATPTRSFQMRRVSRPSASSSGDSSISLDNQCERGEVRAKPSLRKVEPPKLEGDIPSLEQAKAILLEEARNMSLSQPPPTLPSSSSSKLGSSQGDEAVPAKRGSRPIAGWLARLSGSPERKRHNTASVPLARTLPSLRRNHSLGSHDRPRFKPVIPPKPTGCQLGVEGRRSTNHCASGNSSSTATADLPTVGSKRNSLSSSGSSSGEDSQSACLERPESRSSSLSSTMLSPSASSPSLTGKRDHSMWQASADIRRDLDDTLIMDLLKTLDMDPAEKQLLVRKGPQCECISPQPTDSSVDGSCQIVLTPDSKKLIYDEPSGEAQAEDDYADTRSTSQPHTSSIASSDSGVGSEASVDKDQEILSAWLRSIQSEECLGLFVAAGYDMPTISRMTPEDLTAIGITKPAHRRRLFAEISKLNISDGIPDYKPDSLSLLLKLLRLEEYESTLIAQGYDSVEKVAELTWEDIDDIGITKLGHQKKLTLAIKKIKNFPRFQPAFRPLPPSSSSHQSLARHSSIDLGNPHARPITVPVPPEQFESAAWTPTPLQHSISQTDTFTLPHHMRQGHSGCDLNRQLADEQLYFAWHQQQELQQQQQDIFTQQQALRGRSLESLEPNFEWYDMVNSWRSQMMADGSAGGGAGGPSSGGGTTPFIEGTSTLQRPRGLLGHKSPRPVAKVQGTSTVSIRDQIITGAVGSCSQTQSHQMLVDAADEVAKPELLAGQGPVPPKRGGIMSAGVTKAHDVGDTAFATCVQSLTSRFTLDTCEGSEGIEESDGLTLALAAHADDAHSLALARNQLSSASSAHIPRPPPPPEPPTAAGPLPITGSSSNSSFCRSPRSPQRERSPVPPGDSSTALAPQVIELNQAMQSELKMKLKQRNHQAVGGSGAAGSGKPAPAQDQQLKELPRSSKSDADLEREKFLAKLESVRKKSERKETAAAAATTGTATGQDGRSPLLGRKGKAEPPNSVESRKAEGRDRKEDREAGTRGTATAVGDAKQAEAQRRNTSVHSNPIENEIRSLQECMASVMDPKPEAEPVEAEANDYDTNPFTALLSQIEKNVDKEFLERKRNEKAATADTSASSSPSAAATADSATHKATTQAAISTSTTRAATTTTTTTTKAVTTNATASPDRSNSVKATNVRVKHQANNGAELETSVPSVVDAAYKRLSKSHPHQVESPAPAMDIRPIEVKLEGSTSSPSSSSINNLNRPYEIARSTKTEPMITQNKFFSTIGVETKVINLEDRPHRKSDAGLPSARGMANCFVGGSATAIGNNNGDNQRRASVDATRTGFPNSVASTSPANNQHHNNNQTQQQQPHISSANNASGGGTRVAAAAATGHNSQNLHSQSTAAKASSGNRMGGSVSTAAGVSPDAAQQLQAAQAEFDNKFGNMNNVSKESAKEKRIIEVRHDDDHQLSGPGLADDQQQTTTTTTTTAGFREGLVSSARKIFEVCAGPKGSSSSSTSSSSVSPASSGSTSCSPAIPRRNSVKRDDPPVPPPRGQRPPDVPPRTPSQAARVEHQHDQQPQSQQQQQQQQHRQQQQQQQRPPLPPPRDQAPATGGASAECPPPKNHQLGRRVAETPKVIQDIEHMLSSLTDQLDAMLD